MLPEKSDPRWKTLLDGKKQYQFKVLSVSMLISRIQRDLRMNANLDAQKKYVDEIYDFFTKYEKILSDDIKAIFS